MNSLQETIFYSRYSRWIEAKNRRESWQETVTRVMDWLKLRTPPQIITQDEWTALEDNFLFQEVLPAMRIVQMAGPALTAHGDMGAYNCSYVAPQQWADLAEILYILMQGTGVGFSVEDSNIKKFPEIKPLTTELAKFTVPDTTEGWCDSLKFLLEHSSNGATVEFDYSRIRPYGVPLKTKGGVASGPEPLKQLHQFVTHTLNNRRGKKLRSIDVHDIICFIGNIVQVGGVRRSATISLSDIDDTELRNAKTGNWWDQHIIRSMANNSAVYTEKPSLGQFIDEWKTLIESRSGERGIFNREGAKKTLPKRRKKGYAFGTNPCGEILLRPYQTCNLSIAVARPYDNEESLANKVKLAALFGTIQSQFTSFKYVNSQWKDNCEEERLLGVDITGQLDCPLFTKNKASDIAALLEKLKTVAINANKDYAARLGINQSTAVTCVKPSGNSSQLLNSSSGLHPRYAPYYIRRVQIGANTPIAQFLRDQGIPCEPYQAQSFETARVWVFEFPVKSPDGAITRNDRPAIEQCEYWLLWKKHFTEHNPSVTIYVNDDEWLEVGAWVYKNWDYIVGMSFLPKDDHVYKHAPYEEITAETYTKLANNFPKSLEWEKLVTYETYDTTEVNRDYACVGGSCEI